MVCKRGMQWEDTQGSFLVGRKANGREEKMLCVGVSRASHSTCHLVRACVPLDAHHYWKHQPCMSFARNWGFSPFWRSSP